MKTIILDYENGRVCVVNHPANFQIENIETMLTDKYNFSLNQIEWMTVEDIDIQYLPDLSVII